MATDRWDPLRDLMHLRERVDGLFQDVLGRSGAVPEADVAGVWRPHVDVWEQAGRYHLRIDLPGVPPGEAVVEVDGGALRIQGERRTDGSVPRQTFLRAERPHGRFALSIALPPNVDPAGIEARQKDGLLEITLRRRDARTEGPVRVDVK